MGEYVKEKVGSVVGGVKEKIGSGGRWEGALRCCDTLALPIANCALERVHRVASGHSSMLCSCGFGPHPRPTAPQAMACLPNRRSTP